MTLPFRHVAEVQQLRGIEQVTYASWLGAKDPSHDREFFGTWFVDPEGYFDVFKELSIAAEARSAWREKRNAAIVGDVLLAKLGWKVGDRIGLESGFFPEQPLWQFEIVGSYLPTAKSFGRSNVYVRWDYVNELAAVWHKDRVGWIMTRVAGETARAEVAQRIDRHFEASGDATFTQDESAFVSSFGEGMSNMMKVLHVACAGLLLIMSLLIGNTVAMAVRERRTEYGTLRALGFRPTQLARHVLLEAAALGVLGGGLGLGLAFPLIRRGLGVWIERHLGSFFPYFEIEPWVLAAALLGPVVVAVAAAVLPALSMSRIPVTDALRRAA
jgi:putative ABC transport system permease protein